MSHCGTRKIFDLKKASHVDGAEWFLIICLVKGSKQQGPLRSKKPYKKKTRGLSLAMVSRLSLVLRSLKLLSWPPTLMKMGFVTTNGLDFST